MWLVANDIIIGLTFGSFLVNNSEYMANIILRDYLDVRSFLLLSSIQDLNLSNCTQINGEVLKFLSLSILYIQ